MADTICPKKEGTRLMGWCTTGQHEACRISYVYDGKETRCGCINHPEVRTTAT